MPRICGGQKELSSVELYGLGGKLSVLLNAHGIYIGNMPTDVQLDLCRDHLVAQDVLNLTIKAVGDNHSWSLSGVKGLRWLTFE